MWGGRPQLGPELCVCVEGDGLCRWKRGHRTAAVKGASGSKTSFYGNKKLNPEGRELGEHCS